jgi:hypothetical protein
MERRRQWQSVTAPGLGMAMLAAAGAQTPPAARPQTADTSNQAGQASVVATGCLQRANRPCPTCRSGMAMN